MRTHTLASWVLTSTFTASNWAHLTDVPSGILEDSLHPSPFWLIPFLQQHEFKNMKINFQTFFCYFFHLNFCKSSWELHSFHSYTRAEIPSERVSFLWCQNWRREEIPNFIYFSVVFFSSLPNDWVDELCLRFLATSKRKLRSEKKWKSQLKY